MSTESVNGDQINIRPATKHPGLSTTTLPLGVSGAELLRSDQPEPRKKLPRGAPTLGCRLFDQIDDGTGGEDASGAARGGDHGEGPPAGLVPGRCLRPRARK